MSVSRRLATAAALPLGVAVTACLTLVLPVLVPPLLVLALASLVRLGESILDRLMTSLALGTGLLVAAGLGFSVWPWGLDPVPVAVAAWVGLWALAAATGRRPRLPRPTAPDIALPVTALVAMVPAWSIFRAHGFTGRLAVLMIGEDNSRHLMWWQGIREAGAYLFLAGDRYPDSVVPGWDTYPQGWHLVAATLDRFGQSAGGGDLDRYLVLTLLTHFYLLLNVVWLALVTRRRTGVLQAAGAAVVGASLATGSELFRAVVSGYPAESLGLSMALAAGAVAALASRRPDGSTLREPIVVMAALLVAASFAYYVFLVPQGLLALALLWRRGRDALRTPIVAVLAVVASLALAAIMPVLGVRRAVEAGGLEVGGRSAPIWLSLVVLGGLSAAGLAVSGGWRSPAVRWALAVAAIFLGFGVALAVAVQSGYYVHKIWHVPIAVGAAMCAAVVLWVPQVEGRRGPLRAAPAVGGLAAAAVLGSGLTPLGPGMFTDPEQGTSNLGVWRSDFWAQTSAATGVVRAMEVPAPPDDVTSFVVDLDPWVSYRTNLFLSALTGTSAELFDVHYVGGASQPERLTEQLRIVPGKVRLLVTSPEAAELARTVASQADRPGRVRVVPLPDLATD